MLDSTLEIPKPPDAGVETPLVESLQAGTGDLSDVVKKDGNVVTAEVVIGGLTDIERWRRTFEGHERQQDLFHSRSLRLCKVIA